MSIWILAVLLFALIAALGYLQGAIRLMVSLTGLFLGAALAFPLAWTANPILGWFNVTNTIWKWVLPPLIVFLFVWLVFVGLSFFVHHKFEMYFKFRTDDLGRYRIQRLNRRLGISLGAVMAVFWIYLIGATAYGVGYLTTQLSGEDTSSTSIRWINNAKLDLQETGLESSVASFDLMPRSFYQAADILGLIRHNPVVLSRLSQYPPFLALGERTEFQEIATDSEYNNLLQSKADIAEIIRHPKTQAILQNKEIMDELLRQDFNDLRQFLETGASPKFEDEKILGRWELDMYATLAQERKRRPNMKSSEMIQLKKVMGELMPKMTLVAMPDNKVQLKVELSDQMKQMAEAAAARMKAAQPRDAFSGMSPDMAQRYRQSAPPSFSEGEEADAPPEIKSAPNQLFYAAEGTWERNELKPEYRVTIQDERGKSAALPVVADDEKLLIRSPVPALEESITMVFYKDE